MAHGSRSNDYLIVMTACIDPSSGPARVARSDPKVRLVDYLSALRFWFKLGEPRLRHLLFIDNSGYPLDEVQRVVDREKPAEMKVELVSMNTNNYPPHVHYGYSELKMLDTGLERSALAKATRYWMKVTGRLTFPLVGRLLDRLPRNYHFAVDLRNGIPVFSPPQHWVHTRLAIFSKAFYVSEMRGVCERCLTLPPNTPIETMLYDLFMRHRGEKGAILRLPVHVPPHGHSAFQDFSYQGMTRTAVDWVRHGARVFLPAWWC